MTPTNVLRTLPKHLCYNRNMPGKCNQQLRELASNQEDSTVNALAYGVLWADNSGRIGGTLSLALRDATPWQAAQLISTMVRDGVKTSAEVPYWLNQHGREFFGIPAQVAR